MAGPSTGAISGNEPSSSATALLEARGITKSYGHIRAVRGVDFSIDEGEIVALVGDNGAGKSTLIKCLCGALRPDSGTITVEGAEHTFGGPADARRAGISVVYQDLALVELRDVAHNIFLGDLPRRWPGIVDAPRMRREAERALKSLEIKLPSSHTPVSQLSGGQRQAVAIARALIDAGRLMVLDEPTAALGVREGRHVLELLDRLRGSGVALLVVSHNLEHVFTLADRILVLQGGRLVGARKRSETTVDDIVHLIVGSEGADAGSAEIDGAEADGAEADGPASPPPPSRT